MIFRYRFEPPFVFRGAYNRLRTENHTLRDALRNANAELHKYKLLVGGLRDGHKKTTEAVERIVGRR